MIHDTALVEPKAKIGENVFVWHFVHIRSGAKIKDNVTIGRDAYIDSAVVVNEGTKIQNGVSLYNGVQVGKYCFIGPHATFTNDLYPRAGSKTWKIVKTKLKNGCSIGAGTVIVCGSVLEEFCMIGSGSVVTGLIPAFHLASGSPARVAKMICACGMKTFQLNTNLIHMIQPCCKKALSKEMLKVAREAIRKLSR